MNTFQLLAVLVGQGIFMTVFTFALIYGVASVFGIAEDVMDIRLTIMFFVLSCLVLYGTSFGIFAGVQKDNCGEVRNWKQIAVNASIPTVSQVILMSLILIVPWFQRLVGNLLPPDTPAFGKSATAFAYYTFWATVLGGALGGTLSGSCKTEDVVDPLAPLETGLKLPGGEGIPGLPVE